MTIIQNPTQYKIPTWFLNRQRDIVDGKDGQVLANGVDSVLDRSRRLLYVCVSRAKLGVAIILFTSNTPTAAGVVSAGPLAPHVEVHQFSDLT